MSNQEPLERRGANWQHRKDMYLSIKMYLWIFCDMLTSGDFFSRGLFAPRWSYGFPIDFSINPPPPPSKVSFNYTVRIHVQPSQSYSTRKKRKEKKVGYPIARVIRCPEPLVVIFPTFFSYRVRSHVRSGPRSSDYFVSTICICNAYSYNFLPIYWASYRQPLYAKGWLVFDNLCYGSLSLHLCWQLLNYGLGGVVSYEIDAVLSLLCIRWIRFGLRFWAGAYWIHRTRVMSWRLVCSSSLGCNYTYSYPITEASRYRSHTDTWC